MCCSSPLLEERSGEEVYAFKIAFPTAQSKHFFLLQYSFFNSIDACESKAFLASPSYPSPTGEGRYFGAIPNLHFIISTFRSCAPTYPPLGDLGGFSKSNSPQHNPNIFSYYNIHFSILLMPANQKHFCFRYRVVEILL